MSLDGTWSTAAEVQEQAVGAADEFPALSRLARVLLVTGVLCLCGAAGLALVASDASRGGLIRLSGLVADLTSVGVALVGAGLVGLAVRWPPGAAGRRAVALLVVAVVAALAALVGLSVAAAGLSSGLAPLLGIGYPALTNLVGGLLTAALLRSLLWRWADPRSQPPSRPALPRGVWRPCVALGFASLLLGGVARLFPNPFGVPAFDSAAVAIGQTVRQAAEVGLGAALLAAVLLLWLHVRAPQTAPPARRTGDDVEHDAAQRSWDAVPPLTPAPATLVRWLVVGGLGALVLAGLVRTFLYGEIVRTVDANLLAAVGLVLAVLLPLAGAAALTAGLVGLVLERALPLLPAALPEPSTEPPDASEGPAQEAATVPETAPRSAAARGPAPAPAPTPGPDPDARWRP